MSHLLLPHGKTAETAPGPLDTDRSTAAQREADLLFEPLVAAALDGDAKAASSLYQRARERLVRLALALGAPPDQVPDLVQEVLIAAWRNLHRFDPQQGSFITWLLPGLRGRIANLLRSGGRHRRFLERARAFFVRRDRVSAPMGQREVDARLTLSKLLGRLTERQQEVIALYDLEGLSAAETAHLLGLTEAGVRSIARDARQRLRDEARRLDERSTGGRDP